MKKYVIFIGSQTFYINAEYFMLTKNGIEFFKGTELIGCAPINSFVKQINESIKDLHPPVFPQDRT